VRGVGGKGNRNSGQADVMKSFVRWLPWCALLVAFCAFGLHVHGRVVEAGLQQVFGYDYATYMRQIRDFDWIAYTGFRHPGLGLVMSPVVIVSSALTKVNGFACDCFIVAVMALIGVANVWLVRKIAGWFAACLFLSFGFTWVLAAVPESFPLSMTCLLSVVLLCQSETPAQAGTALGRRDWIWLALALLTTCVTITNGLKVAVAYMIFNWSRIIATRISVGERRVPMWVALIAGLVIVALAGCAFFAVRMVRWNMAHPGEVKSIAGALAQTMSWVPEGLGLLGRLKGFAVNFAVVPLLPMLSFSVLSKPPMPSVVGLAWGTALILWAALAMCACWRIRVVRVMAGMFSVDVLIHFVCGWGLDEGWVFCAHWFWMVPVLVGLHWRSRKQG